LGAPFLYQVSILIENFSVPGDDASTSSGMRFQRKNGGQGVNCVSKDDWSVKSPFENGQERKGVDARRLAHEAGGNGQTKQAMSHGPAEGIALGGRMIDMKRIEIARQSGEQDDIGFRDSPAWALPLISDHEIIE
jgi:hypothetical protein